MFKLKDNTLALFQEGEKYLVTLSKTLERKSRFNNDLLYSITVMCCEKLFVALLSHYDEMADHHMPDWAIAILLWLACRLLWPDV